MGGVNLPAHEAARLRAAVARTPPGRPGAPLTDEQRGTYESLAVRRAAGEPLQYLEGTAAFGPIEVKVDRRALIPRPETEGLWELAVAALGEAGPGTVVVDLCTGTGALAFALEHAFPSARVYAVDDDEAALALARENAAALDSGVTLLHGDLFAALPEQLMGRLDLVVANPPYVASGEWDGLPGDVRDYEPRHALVAGPLGTEVLQRIAEDGYWWLGVGAHLLCEIGETQDRAAERAFAGFDRHVLPDLAGRNRYLVARKGSPCCV